jgi:hypothetical protein
MIEGGLVAESMRPGSVLSGLPLMVEEIRRYEVGSPGPGQPSTWTLIVFQADDSADDSAAEALAEALAGCLLAEGGWYGDFRTATEKFVVYAGRVFRYPRGDAAGDAAARDYGRSVGVPEPQLDWAT